VRRRRDVVYITIIIILVLLLLWCLLKRYAPPYQPSVGVYGGVDLVALEDFVAVEDGKYVVRAVVAGRFSQIPAWGWSVSANITYSTLAVNLAQVGGRGVVLVFGIASRNATLSQDLGNGFRVYAHGGGGYVVYNGSLAGWCLRPPARYNDAYVWLPASTCNINVQYKITVEPISGTVLINARPAEVVDVELVKVKGVLPGWLVYSDKGGVYYFTVRP
jgi:hypothetical protein